MEMETGREYQLWQVFATSIIVRFNAEKLIHKLDDCSTFVAVNIE